MKLPNSKLRTTHEVLLKETLVAQYVIKPVLIGSSSKESNDSAYFCLLTCNLYLSPSSYNVTLNKGHFLCDSTSILIFSEQSFFVDTTPVRLDVLTRTSTT